MKRKVYWQVDDRPVDYGPERLLNHKRVVGSEAVASEYLKIDEVRQYLIESESYPSSINITKRAV